MCGIMKKYRNVVWIGVSCRKIGVKYGVEKRVYTWKMFYLNELSDAEGGSLCHGNWIEIQRLYKRIDIIEALLREAGINVHEAEY